MPLMQGVQYVLEREIILPAGTPGSRRLLLSPHGDRIAFCKKFDRDFVVEHGGNHEITCADSMHIKLWHVQRDSLEAVLEGHAAPITALAFSPDNTLLVSGDLHGTIKIWDLATLFCVMTFNAHDAVRALSFSPDNLVIFIGCSSGVYLNAISCINIHGRSMHLLTRLEPDSPISQLLALPDECIMTASLEGTLHKRDRYGALLEQYRYSKGYQGKDPIVSYASLAEKAVVASSDKGKIYLCLLKKRQLVNFYADPRIASVDGSDRLITQRAHRGAIYALCFSHNGNYLFSGSHDQTVKIWDRKTGELIQELTGFTAPVCTLAQDEQGALMVGCQDGTVRLFKDEDRAYEMLVSRCALLNFQGIESSRGEDQGVATQASAPVSRPSLLTVLYERSLGFSLNATSYCRLYEEFQKKSALMNSMVCLPFSDSNGEEVTAFTKIAVFPDGRIVTSEGRGVVRVWDGSQGHCLQHFASQKAGDISALALHENRYISAASGSTMTTWDTLTGERLVSWGYGQEILSLTALPGLKIAVRTYTGVVVWDVLQPKWLAGFDLEEGGLMAPTGDGKILISDSRSKLIWVWDYVSSQHRFFYPFHVVSAMTVLPSGMLVTGGYDGSMGLWEVKGESYKRHRRFTTHDEAITLLRALIGGKILACSKNKRPNCRSLTIWDSATGFCVDRTEMIPSCLQDIIVQPDGTIIGIGAGSPGKLFRIIKLGEFIKSCPTHEINLIFRFIRDVSLRYENLLDDEKALYTSLAYMDELVRAIRLIDDAVENS